MRSETTDNHETPALPFGELFRDPRHLRGDLRLLRQAVRGDWPIPEASRVILMARVSQILREPDALPAGVRTRAALEACRVLLSVVDSDLRNI